MKQIRHNIVLLKSSGQMETGATSNNHLADGKNFSGEV